MVALELLRQHWVWGALILGLFHCWMIYLAHYRAPESQKPEGLPSPASGGGAGGGGPTSEPMVEIQEFPGGIQETNLPVPAVLRVFYFIMTVWALAYVLWIRCQVGSY